MRKLVVTVCIVLVTLISYQVSGQQATDFVDEKTISSVVQIGKIYNIFLVQGMPQGHRVTVNYGKPDFGGGKVVNQRSVFYNIGSGVIVTKNGWILSNAHVTDDWTPDAFWVQDVRDPQGRPLKAVSIPANPGYVWITMVTEEELKRRVRKNQLRYLATTNFIDWDYYKHERDRSVCKIIAHAKMNPQTNLPEKGEDFKSNEEVPYTDLRNPFDIDIIEAGVTAMGYPGIGPPQFITISKGRLQGYDDWRSHIMHTAFISGGNSGGGLFYENKLIGINTWDRPEIRPGGQSGRNMSLAQPITYWGEAFAAVRLWYEVAELPVIPSEWVKADIYSKDPYVNQVYVGFNLRSRVNEKVSLKTGVVIGYRKDVSLEEAIGFIDFRDYIQKYEAVQQLAWMGHDLNAIAGYLNLSVPEAKTMAEMSWDELVGSLGKTGKKYLEILKPADGSVPKFFSGNWGVDQNGQVVAALPPSSEVKLTVMSNGYKQRTINFSTKGDIVQGPHTIKVPPAGK
jgi:hypothetical protein